jgi:hypothetical protein
MHHQAAASEPPRPLCHKSLVLTTKLCQCVLKNKKWGSIRNSYGFCKPHSIGCFIENLYEREISEESVPKRLHRDPSPPATLKPPPWVAQCIQV